MIGIPILDGLSETDLVRVAKGELEIRIPIARPIQVLFDPNTEMEPNTLGAHLIEEIQQEKIVRVCKMEIESRLGLIYLKEKIEGITS